MMLYHKNISVVFSQLMYHRHDYLFPLHHFHSSLRSLDERERERDGKHLKRERETGVKQVL